MLREMTVMGIFGLSQIFSGWCSIWQMKLQAGLETVLSAAYSLKHATDMEKGFPTQDEAFDKAKQMGLTPDQAARQIEISSEIVFFQDSGHFSV